MSVGARRRRSAAAEKAGPAAAQAANPVAGGRQHVVARLVQVEAGLYSFGLAAETGWRQTLAGLALPALHVAAPEPGASVEIADDSGGWLGGARQTLFVKASARGTALVTAYLPRDPRTAPLDLEIRRLDSPVVTKLAFGGPPAEEAAWSSLELIVDVRGRRGIRFVDSPWAGRLGRGLWIENFAVVPQDSSIAAAIEYKGLAASGAETPWLASPARCGAQEGIPLIGFAVRQKAAAPGGLRLDCEYSGVFSSGTTAGPMRNGAPCRSPRDNDPLEGLQLRITERPPRPTAPSSP